MSKPQKMAGSDLGDDHKVFFAGDKALMAGGLKNTSKQFEINKKSENKNKEFA